MTERDLRKVSDLLRFLTPAMSLRVEQRIAYQQVVAMLADVSLQAAMNYETVVRPRVHAIVTRHPMCVTTSDLVQLVKRVPVSQLLNWRGTEKVLRFARLLELLVRENLERVDDIVRWTQADGAREKFCGLAGMGDKSFDYLAMLCGHSTFPLDRHIFRFLDIAGVDVKRSKYQEAKTLLLKSCKHSGLDPFEVEKGIWHLMRSCS